MKEGIWISQKELNRWHVLRMVLEERVTLVEAARVLGVSYRHAKRLKKSAKEGGLPGILHGNRGRSPANKTDAAVRERIVGLSSERYSNFNDSHFTEMLAEREGTELSRETVRRAQGNKSAASGGLTLRVRRAARPRLLKCLVRYVSSVGHSRGT